MEADAPFKPDFFMCPVLSVSDLPASLAYYRDKLGFKVNWTNDSGDLVIAAVERPGIDLILQNGSGMRSSARPAAISAELHEHMNLDQLHDELRQRGAIVRKAPFQVSWQPKMHELDVEDPDGNVLMFFGDLG